MKGTFGAIAAVLALSASACSSGGPWPSSPPAGAAAIKVDPSETFQIMSGWEATAWLEEYPGYSRESQAVRETMIDRAVNEVGIDRLRLEVRAGAERPASAPGWDDYAARRLSDSEWGGVRYATINDNADPNVIDPDGFDFSELDFLVSQTVLPMKRALEARGRTLSLNICYVAFTRQNAPGSQFDHDDPAEYAEFVLAVHQHLESAYGLRPDLWEVILEPDNPGVAQNWGGEEIGELIVAADQRLQAAGFTTKFVAPSTTSMDNAPAFFDGMATIPGAVERLAELSYHRYAGGRSALGAIAELARANDIRSSMLECWPRARCDAGHVALQRDLVEGEAAAWQGRVLRGLFDFNGWRVTMRADVRYNRHYFNFIDRGAVRIGAISSNDAFEPVAFINDPGPNEEYVVVVNASGGGSLSVGGLPAGDYGVQYTTSRETARDLDDVRIAGGAPVRAAIPAAGVVTIYGK